MLRFGIFALIICFTDAQVHEFAAGTPRIFEPEINITLNDIQKGLAKIDPLTIPLLEAEFSHQLMNLSFRLENVRLQDFSKFVATNIKVNVLPPSMHLVIHVNNLEISVPSYNMNLKIVFLPIYGTGTMNFHTKNVDIGFSVTIGIRNTGIYVENVLPVFNLTDTLLNVTGFLDNEDVSQIVSTSTTECFPQFLKNYGNRLNEVVGILMKGFLNGRILNKSYKDELIPKAGTIKTYRVQKHDINAKLRVHF